MMHSQRRNNSEHGFTLIELLVVIGVIVLLVSVAIPGLAIAKEHARRTVCLANIRQFLLGIHIYAEKYDNRLPVTGFRNTFNLTTSTYDQVTESIGSDECMFCPSLGNPFIRHKASAAGGIYGNDGYCIGYNYLGGHPDTPWPVTPPAVKEWKSALLSTARTTVPIITELNAWSPAADKTVAPHTKRGPARLSNDYMNTGLGGVTSEDIGAEGGNIGLLDGSAYWKHIDSTTVHIIDNNSTTEWFSAW